MTETTFIYALKDPETGNIRYVGKANDPRSRFAHHWHRNRARNEAYKGAWIRGLLLRGIKPELEVLDEVPYEQWQFWEREYIRVFKMTGMRLVNLTPGGDGAPKGKAPHNLGKPMTLEHRQKLSASHKGVKLSMEHRAAQSAAGRGRKQTPEWIAKRLTQSANEKRTLTMTGKKASPQAVENMRRAQSGKVVSEETKHKLRLANIGRKHSEETKLKMSLAQSQRHMLVHK